QLRARPLRRAARGLRRRDYPEQGRPHLGRLRRQLLHGPPGGGRHAAHHRRHPRGHHSRHLHHAPARRDGDHRRREVHRPHGAVARRRGLPRRDRGADRPDHPRGPPPHRRRAPGPSDGRAAGPVLRGRSRPQVEVPVVVRADLRGGRPRGGLSAARSPGRRFDVVTFDCYGTLIDWEGGIGDWFETAAARSGITLDRRRALDLYASIEPVVEAESYRPYRDVLAETARRVAEQMSWPLSEQEAKGLAASLPDWSPFPDTNPALRRIAAAGYRFGILSNVDDDLLAGTRRHLEVAFDILITAEQVRSYKPAHGHFEEAR